jgi:hypothetical protein
MENGEPGDGNVPEPTAPNPDGSCPVDRKKCGGVCVALVDPGYGCASASCEPCSGKES